MNPLLREIRHTPLLWMLIFVPIVLIAARMMPAAHTLLFVLAVLAIVPLAALLSHATEAVSEKTGDAVGGLLNATLGNLTELIIAITALHAGQYMLVGAGAVKHAGDNSVTFSLRQVTMRWPPKSFAQTFHVVFAFSRNLNGVGQTVLGECILTRQRDCNAEQAVEPVHFLTPSCKSVHISAPDG